MLAVAAGGAIGAVARVAFAEALLRILGPGFPWAILVVNVIGCFFMGVIAELAGSIWGISQELRMFLMSGILGGFTTFSAFALDVAVLTERGEIASAMFYVSASVVGSVLFLFFGLWFVRMFQA